MERFLQYTINGIPVAAVYAISATGLVVTYTISGIFNFAHGAFSMMAALTYWQLHVEWGVPTWPALLLVVFVIAPIFGAVVERGLIRGLEGASEVVRVVVTTSLMLGLLGPGQTHLAAGENRNIAPFYGSDSVEILGATGHDPPRDHGGGRSPGRGHVVAAAEPHPGGSRHAGGGRRPIADAAQRWPPGHGLDVRVGPRRVARRGGRRAHRTGPEPRADHADAARRHCLLGCRGRSAPEPAAHLPRRAHRRPGRVVAVDRSPTRRPSGRSALEAHHRLVADRAPGR